MMLEGNKRTVKKFVWEIRETYTSNVIVQKVIVEMGITANVAKLGAMMLNRYIAKSKGKYTE
jgi:hypothetical protein